MWVRLFAALVVAGGAHAQEPKAPAKPVVGTWEVKYTDDSTMKLTLLEDTISLLTPHGTLQIPVRDIRKIEFGVRLSEADQKAVDASVVDLAGTDNAKREAAKGLLAEIGPKALGALQRAARPLTGEARAQFAQVIDKLTAQLPTRKPAPRDTDVIHTDESVIAGRLAVASLRVNTFQFGEQKLKTGDVTVMQFGKLAAAARNDTIELVDANTLTQIALLRVGQTVGVRVTGVNSGAVWGSGPYTSDSTPGMAAVHAGALKVGETGVVRIRFGPNLQLYGGSTENGVTTMQFGPFHAGSFEIVKQP